MVEMLLFSLLDSIEGSVPLYLLLPLLCLTASVQSVQEFTIYRIQHLDIHGNHIGSRSAVVNMEARSSEAAMLNRKCVLIKWTELTSDLFNELLDRGAGAVLVILPNDWRNNNNNNTLHDWMLLEKDLISREISIPIYLTSESEYLNEVYDKLTASVDWDSSAAAALFSSITGEGYSLIADAVEPVPIINPEITTIIGKLSGQGYESELPSVVMTTHYDSFGLAPGLASSGDSGGSGVAAILELARLFSNLYSNPYHKPKYNLLFVLTGADNFNYFGTKYFIEDMLEDADGYLLSEADYTLCLDALAGGSDIFLHVSRPPKEGTKGQELVARMNESLSLVAGVSSVTLNHKKIRIGDESLAWSHERFSLRKVPAGTLSHFSHHSDIRRKSMFHTSSDVDGLSASVQLIAESLVRHILPEINEMDSNYTSGIFTGQMSVHTDSLQSWLDYLSQTGRSQQSLLDKDHPLLLSLQQTLSSYVHEVSTFTHKPDKSDPEFVTYTQSVSIMHSYSVKPAVLDLVLAISILLYMGGVYLLVMYISNISQFINDVKYRIKAKRD